MPRPIIQIPLTEDILSLKSLLERGYTIDQIVEYYKSVGIEIKSRTINERIRTLRGLY